MSDNIQIRESLVINDLETLKVISDPLRIRIVETVGMSNQAGELRTVKQISANLGIPPAKLYYHINLLEKHGLIKVADTQIVSGIIEKHYQVTAQNITVDRELLTTGVSLDEKAEGVMTLLDSTLDAVRDDMQRYIHKIKDDEVRNRFTGNRGQITRETTRLSADQAEIFNNRLVALLEEYSKMSPPEGEESFIYSLALIFNPVLADGPKPK